MKKNEKINEIMNFQRENKIMGVFATIASIIGFGLSIIYYLSPNTINKFITFSDKFMQIITTIGIVFATVIIISIIFVFFKLIFSWNKKYSENEQKIFLEKEIKKHENEISSLRELI